MRFENFSFGSIRVDGMTNDYDLVIDRGELRKRKKRASQLYRAAYWQVQKLNRLSISCGQRGWSPVLDLVLCQGPFAK